MVSVYKSFVLLLFIVCAYCMVMLSEFFREKNQVRILGCLRTKDSRQFLDEFFKYHRAMGITTFYVMDDSEFSMNLKAPDMIYEYVGNQMIKNENENLEKCMQHGLLSGKYDYVLNLDDDEFLWGHSFLHFKHKCVYLPVHFFGTKRTFSTGFTTLDFVHKDREVKRDNKYYVNKPLAPEYYMHHSPNSMKFKNRTLKAIFRVPEEVVDRKSMFYKMKRNVKRGSMIHGYGMDCVFQDRLRIAHYTRSIDDVTRRMNTFWKNIKTLNRRFQNENGVRKYLKERDRTKYRENGMREIAMVKLFN